MARKKKSENGTHEKEYCDGCFELASKIGSVAPISNDYIVSKEIVFYCKSCWEREMIFRSFMNSSYGEEVCYTVIDFP